MPKEKQEKLQSITIKFDGKGNICAEGAKEQIPGVQDAEDTLRWLHEQNQKICGFRITYGKRLLSFQVMFEDAAVSRWGYPSNILSELINSVNDRGKLHDMQNMPTDAYITVTADGIFVGGKPTTTYRGEEIYGAGFVKKAFAWWHEKNSDIQAIHIGAFATGGEHLKPGNPMSEHGSNVWFRMELKNGSMSRWIFCFTIEPENFCAYRCATYCMNSYSDEAFLSVIKNAPIDEMTKTPGGKNNGISTIGNLIKQATQYSK